MPLPMRAKVVEIDALGNEMDRHETKASGRVDQSLAVPTWQMERIRDGIAAVRDGKVAPAEDFFAGIAERHGWSR